MSTIELREVGSKYYGFTGGKQFKLKGEELLASTGSMQANASTIGKINTEIETCKQQMEKISSQLKKRKDIKASKKKSLINMYEGEFFKSYNIPE